MAMGRVRVCAPCDLDFSAEHAGEVVYLWSGLGQSTLVLA